MIAGACKYKPHEASDDYPRNHTFPGKLPVVTNYAHSIYKRSTNHMHVIMTDQPKDLLIKDEASDSLQFI